MKNRKNIEYIAINLEVESFDHWSRRGPLISAIFQEIAAEMTQCNMSSSQNKITTFVIWKESLLFPLSL